MPDLIIKPTATSGNKLILQDQAGGAVLTTADSGATGLLIAPSGTKMIFNQTAAPTGWTKVTSSNDVALRVVSGTVGTGGSVAFETAFASQTVPVHTLAISEMPSHNHGMYNTSGASAGAQSVGSTGSGGVNVQSTGGGGSHGHGSIDLDVQYVDVIIATKD